MLIGHGASGEAYDFFAFDSSGKVWNGSAFVVWNDADYTTYRIAATEVGTSGRFTATEPASTHSWELRIRGATLAGSPTIDSDFVFVTGGVGTGARTVTITVNDGATPISQANVRLTKGLESYVVQTNGSGIASFNVDDGSWIVAIAKPGYQFAGATLVVDSNETQTYSMTGTLVTPADPAKTTGYLTVYNENGAVEQGATVNAVVYVLPTDDSGVAYDSTPQNVVSDAQGLVQFTLFKGVRYEFWRGIDPGMKRRSFLIPAAAGATYELPSIIGKP